MTLLTVMAAEDGVCQGDDRDGILLPSKCGAWRSLPSHIWGERSLEFQDSRRGAREDLHIVPGDRGKAERGPWEAEWASSLIMVVMSTIPAR